MEKMDRESKFWKNIKIEKILSSGYFCSPFIILHMHQGWCLGDAGLGQPPHFDVLIFVFVQGRFSRVVERKGMTSQVEHF